MEKVIKKSDIKYTIGSTLQKEIDSVPTAVEKRASNTVLWLRFKEKAIHYFFLANGLIAVIILLGIFSLLFTEGFPALKKLGLNEFFLSAQWDPTSPERESYGILAMVVSTLMVTVGAPGYCCARWNRLCCLYCRCGKSKSP
jgi:hypothetical protein